MTEIDLNKLIDQMQRDGKTEATVTIDGKTVEVKMKPAPSVELCAQAL